MPPAATFPAVVRESGRYHHDVSRARVWVLMLLGTACTHAVPASLDRQRGREVEEPLFAA